MWRFTLRDNEKSIPLVHEAYEMGKLTLFIGAGVSSSCNLPLWNELAEKIVHRSFPKYTEGYASITSVHETERRAALSKGALESMRIAKKKLGNHFNSVVKESLYSNNYVLSTTVKTIAKLNKVKYVCCYNYDDLLECALLAEGINCIPRVKGEPFLNDFLGVQVFHPHGFLPSREWKTDKSANSIILSEDDYHILYSEPFSWSNLLQLKLLLTSKALFVGCSFADPNIRRLLDICKWMNPVQHFALMKDITHIAGNEEHNLSGWRGLSDGPILRVEKEALEDRGVTPIWFDNYSDIPELLEYILDPTNLPRDPIHNK